ncbi:MAG: putative bifunctional diguanylate cyclase/phosphodiesterase [Treponema sp.]
MAGLDFTYILNNYASPILIVKPVYDHTQITDFEIIFKNESFVSQLNYSIDKCKFYSEFKDMLTDKVDWMGLAIKAANKETIKPVIYKSNLVNNWFRMQMQGIEGGFVIVTLDNVTNEIMKDFELKDSVYHDLLTGLPNRAKFSDDITSYFTRAKENGNFTALLLIDIDNMKNINDLKGHIQGDETLKKSAEILEIFKRSDITGYRFGDDEFMAVIPNADSLDSLANITDAIFEAFDIHGISVSGGVTVYPEDSESEEDLLRFADIAVQYAKKNGKHKFEFFNPDMQRMFIQRLNMQAKITSAFLSNAFYLVYQPQFDVQTGKLRGFEALSRWHDEELGNVSPVVFIPVAEETGLIVPISNWVLNTAFSTLKEWQSEYGFSGVLSVNISPTHLKQESFISDITTLIEQHALDPRTIEIEITEGIMIDNMDDAVAKLKHLKLMGFRISLDDFGTGYSSLSYLQMLPLNTLKIDKSFINNITAQDGIQANITNSIIKMVSKMGLETIAEGVERPAQLEILKQFNCHIVQGFLRGKPMTAESCGKYLQGDSKALSIIED